MRIRRFSQAGKKNTLRQSKNHAKLVGGSEARIHPGSAGSWFIVELQGRLISPKNQIKGGMLREKITSQKSFPIKV
jgi:hypothetical protein